MPFESRRRGSPSTLVGVAVPERFDRVSPSSVAVFAVLTSTCISEQLAALDRGLRSATGAAIAGRGALEIELELADP